MSQSFRWGYLLQAGGVQLSFVDDLDGDLQEKAAIITFIIIICWRKENRFLFSGGTGGETDLPVNQ